VHPGNAAPALRPVDDDDLVARQVEREERRQVLLDRDPAHVKEHRAREWSVLPRLGPEAVEVRAPRQRTEIAEARTASSWRSKGVATIVPAAAAWNRRSQA